MEDILKDAEKNVDKEVVLKGFITHTCKHSGRRCFVMGKDQKTSYVWRQKEISADSTVS